MAKKIYTKNTKTDDKSDDKELKNKSKINSEKSSASAKSKKENSKENKNTPSSKKPDEESKSASSKSSAAKRRGRPPKKTAATDESQSSASEASKQTATKSASSKKKASSQKKEPDATKAVKDDATNKSEDTKKASSAAKRRGRPAKNKSSEQNKAEKPAVSDSSAKPKQQDQTHTNADKAKDQQNKSDDKKDIKSGNVQNSKAEPQGGNTSETSSKPARRGRPQRNKDSSSGTQKSQFGVEEKSQAQPQKAQNRIDEISEMLRGMQDDPQPQKDIKKENTQERKPQSQNANTAETGKQSARRGRPQRKKSSDAQKTQHAVEDKSQNKPQNAVKKVDEVNADQKEQQEKTSQNINPNSKSGQNRSKQKGKNQPQKADQQNAAKDPQAKEGSDSRKAPKTQQKAGDNKAADPQKDTENKDKDRRDKNRRQNNRNQRDSSDKNTPKTADDNKSQSHKRGHQSQNRDTADPVHKPRKQQILKIGNDEYNLYSGNLNQDNDFEKKVKKEVKIPELKIPKINKEKLMRATEKYDPAVAKVLRITENFLKNSIFADKDVHIVVAVSGGVDSITLLDALAQLSPKFGFNLSVAHYNHTLRGEKSDSDEQFVKNSAKGYGLPYYTASGNVQQYADKHSLSIEQAARQLRYNFFERTTRTINADFLLTAHTADDSAETFLINLFRGSGLTGLCGIPPKRQFVKNVVIARPFIKLNKSDLISYADARLLEWREDETNELLFYTRNKIRHELLPILKDNYSSAIIDIINRTAKLIHGADEVISDYVADNLDSVLGQSSNERFELKINILNTFNSFIRGELILAAIEKYFRFNLGSMSKIDRILSLANSSVGSIYELNPSYFVARDREHLIFTRKAANIKDTVLIEGEGEYKLGKQTIKLSIVPRDKAKPGKDGNVEYFNADELPPILELRKWKEGDKFNPLGMAGSMNMSDFLTNEKISLVDKQSVLVLTNKVEIIWVIGMRISDKFKITPDTKKVYKAEIIDSNGKN